MRGTRQVSSHQHGGQEVAPRGLPAHEQACLVDSHAVCALERSHLRVAHVVVVNGGGGARGRHGKRGAGGRWRYQLQRGARCTAHTRRQRHAK